MQRGRESDKTHGRLAEVTALEKPEPGSAEIIPQIGMIEEQREEAGKGRTRVHDTGERLHSHSHRQDEGLHGEATSSLRRSERSQVDQCETPKEERGDPMEELSSFGSHLRPAPNHFHEEEGNLGGERMNKLSSPQRLSPLPSMSAASTVPVDIADQDLSLVDLEAADSNNSGWSAKDEAEKHIQEERDMHNGWAAIRARFREPLAECLAVSSIILIQCSKCSNH